MKCPECQIENPETRKFCRECGAKLILLCPECKAENLPEDKFCGECGYSLQMQKESVPVKYSQLQSYTPKYLADKILTNRSSIEGERKLVTVLFADVAGYTSISEKLDPEDIHQIMDGCFKILMEEIHKYEGTINQFTGDGVMALFGAPIAHEDHAQRACHAALAIQKALSPYNDDLKIRYGIEFKMRIGLNSGPVIVGTIGDDLRMDYTAVGDTTNLASRMESQAAPSSIIVSGNTHKLAKHYFEFKFLGKYQVKGKSEPQDKFQLIKRGEVTSRIEASAVKGLTRFIGREDYVTVLLKMYEKAASGSGQVAGIVGEAGVGKSRLLLELRNRLPPGKFTFLQGRCIQYGGTMAFLPILEILRSYFGIEQGESEQAIKNRISEKVLFLDENLGMILPPILDILSLGVENEVYLKSEPKKKRELIFEALRDLFVKESQQKPLVIAVEDLHWADRTSDEFLDYFIGWLTASKIMLTLLHRPEYTHKWGNKSYFQMIGLDQLTTEWSAELVNAVLEDGEAVPELRNLILSRSAGNPLFIEELTRTLIENGSILKHKDRYILARASKDIQVPDTIHGIIAARIDRLDEKSKLIMQTASVIGREFAFKILQSICGIEQGLKSHLQSLQGLEFIYEKRLFPELEYVFKHALTQEVAYNSLLLKRRCEIHRQIAETIESLYTERLEEFFEILAYHYGRSEDKEKSYRYLKLAGAKAYSRHSNWEAFRYYREAIDMCDRLPQTDSARREAIEVRFHIHRPAALLGYPEDSLHLLQEGSELSTKLGDSKRAAEFESRIASAYALKGNYELAASHGERCFTEAERAQDLDMMAETARDLCAGYLFRGDHSKLLTLSSKIIPIIERTDKLQNYGRIGSTYGRLLIWSGMALGNSGRFEEGIAYCMKAKSAALKYSNDFAIAFAEFAMGSICNIKGDGRSAISHLEQALNIYENRNALMLLGLTLASLGHGQMLLTNMQASLEYAQRGLRIHKEAGIPYLLSYIHWVTGECYIRLSKKEQAIAHCEESLRLSRFHKEKHVEGMALMSLGLTRCLFESSKLEYAEDLLIQAMDVFTELGMLPYCALADLYLGQASIKQGKAEKAESHLKRADALFRKRGMTQWRDQSQKELNQLKRK